METDSSAPKNPDSKRTGFRWFPSIRNPARNPLVDVIRGVSIAMVVVSHLPVFWLRGSGVLFGRDLGSIREGMGYYGVVIFFVVSGFLITSVTLRRYGALNRIDFSGFWWMRFARIIPMLLACLLTMAMFHVYRVPRFEFRDTAVLARTIAAVLSFRFCDLFNTDLAVASWNPLWSLSVEEMFYLAFPFACLAINGFGSALWLFMAVSATAIYLRASSAATPFSVPGCMDFLALGCFVALLRPDRIRDRLTGGSATLVGGVFGLAGVLLIAYGIVADFPIDNPIWASLPCGIGAAFAVVASQVTRPSPSVTKALLPITALGVISYELYLSHLPLSELLASVVPPSSWIAPLLAIAFAVFLHEAYSEPMNHAIRERVAGAKAYAGPAYRSRFTSGVRCVVLPILAATGICVVAVAARGRTVTASEKFRITAVATLPAGTSEPLAYAGRKKGGDLVYLKHEDNGMVRVGIDHWGAEVMLGPPMDPKAVSAGSFKVDFTSEGLGVEFNGKPLVHSPHRCYDISPGPLGVNDIGFTSALTQAVSKIEPN